jgi:hypothetical protein
MRIAIALFLVACTTAMFGQGQGTLDDGKLDEILARLKVAANTEPSSDPAADQLKKVGTNVLSPLLERVRAIDVIAKTNVKVADEKMRQLRAAFRIIGPDARPLLPELTKEFTAGRCLGNAPDAIAQIGGPTAINVLIAGMTNQQNAVKISAVNALYHLKGEPTAREAVNPLITLLNETTNSYVKGLAVNTLGGLAVEADIAIPALLEVAEHDRDFVVRALAVKAIGSFGGGAAFARERLTRIAANDPQLNVRREAERVLKRLEK